MQDRIEGKAACKAMSGIRSDPQEWDREAEEKIVREISLDLISWNEKGRPVWKSEGRIEVRSQKEQGRVEAEIEA